MQHAALDSISSPPKLTGASFSAVSLPSNPSEQNIVNIRSRSPHDPGFSVCKEYLRVIANRRCRQTGANVLYPGVSKAFSRSAEMEDMLNIKIHLNPIRRISDRWCIARGFAGHWGKALAHA